MWATAIDMLRLSLDVGLAKLGCGFAGYYWHSEQFCDTGPLCGSPLHNSLTAFPDQAHPDISTYSSLFEMGLIKFN